MNITWPINVPRAEARRRLEELAAELAPRYTLTVTWGDAAGEPSTATWRRPGSSGTVIIEDEEIQITGRLGLLSLAEARITARITELLRERFPPGERAASPWQPPQVIQQQQGGGGIDWAAAGKAALGLVHGIGGTLANMYSGGAAAPVVDFLGRTYEQALGIPYQQVPTVKGLFDVPHEEDYDGLERLLAEQNPELWRRTIRALRRMPIEGVSDSEMAYKQALRVARALYARAGEKLPGGDRPDIAAITRRIEKEAESQTIFLPRKTAATSPAKYLGF